VSRWPAAAAGRRLRRFSTTRPLAGWFVHFRGEYIVIRDEIRALGRSAYSMRLPKRHADTVPKREFQANPLKSVATRAAIE
jgi:hypothetical protein